MNPVNLLKFIGILTVLSGLTISTPASAITGNEFQNLDEQYKFGYVMGAAEQIWVQDGSVKGKKVVCFPKGNTYDQMSKIVDHYLSEHPERLHEEMAGLLLTALTQAFPCK